MPQKKIRSVFFTHQKITLLIITLIFPFQFARGAPIDLPTPVKVAIDPARVKREKPEKRPGDLAIPGTIKETEKDITKPTKKVKTDDSIKFKLSSIDIIGDTVYKKGELLQYYKKHLNKDISLSDLKDIANNITARYRKDGYVISRAIIPPQKIAKGKVIIQVIEGYISEIYIEGESRKAYRQIKRYAEKIKKMGPLQTKKLERYVLLINDTPGLIAKTILSPSPSKVGAADLTFVIEQKKVAGEIYLDNRGSPYMGPEQGVASLSDRDALLAADELTIQTIFTPFHNELRHAQTIYTVPIGTSGLRLELKGAYTETRPGFTLKDLNLVGRSKVLGAKLEYPLIRTRIKNLWLTGQFDWLNTYTKFENFTLFSDRIQSIRVGALYDCIDKLKGANLISIKFSKGLGFLNARPLKPPTVPLSRNLGLSKYKKINMDLSRYQSIGQNWLLFAALSGQYSFHNRLLSSEEFSFGGHNFGRAYNPSEITGDSGINGKLELRYNTYPDFRFLQQIQYFTYYELGTVWNVGDDYSQEDKDSASNLGGGLRATFNGYFYGNIELAKPLSREVSTNRQQGLSDKAWVLYFGLGVEI